ncbi:Asp-tRNA(Asn)/Glu-tRNA(Gln) amidotransferase subunit GatC [Ammoniphilus resinae]|uniref:Aspartyl/glutamyl-tRNA(Asn/Gln) amidotransferase subunit C n=1 Tax=Ammoniphilus resinae TaxID=861532 RepID=A0ABS4GIL0_9BACL|nr:Asp-tRNA(Asn)/Glu-tRNA(Gln) amidotransferase subunit GatC [Ammoniphilus resinae]MBP1930093.1 aspartyl-tRNA(Asn)/glutamyl-tRNA(Gln) amidotransferase subunit C [Ammoniphilus resinae]
MSGISRDQVAHIANLARLNLTAEEAEQYTTQMNAIFSFFEKLNELDTEQIEPTSHVMEVYNVIREDDERPSIDREVALRNAPDEEDGQFKVPAVMD